MDRYFSLANILIASQDEILDDLLELSLQRFEHFVRIAENGKDAIKFIHDDFCDLALFDYKMKDMSALELLKELKKSYQAAPISMGLGTEFSSDDLKECARAGARDFVVKPFSIPDVILRIEKLLKAANLS